MTTEVNEVADSMLTADQVGKLLGLEPRTVRMKAADAKADFPRAVKLSQNPHGQRHSPSRWLLSEVRAYIERCKVTRPEPKHREQQMAA